MQTILKESEHPKEVIDQRNNAGVTPVFAAACADSVEIVSYLHENGADLSVVYPDNGSNILMFAAQCGATKVLKYFFSKKLYGVNDRNRQGLTALDYAAASGLRDTMEFLVENGANIHNVDNQGFTPLLNSLTLDAPRSTFFLIEKGADPLVISKDGRNGVMSAAFIGNLTTLKFFLEKGVDVHHVCKI